MTPRPPHHTTTTQPGNLFTRGPGAYKIPAFNDVPSDFRVTLLKDATNPVAVHSSKAIGEPPFFMAASAFFAIKVGPCVRALCWCVGWSPVCAPLPFDPTPHPTKQTQQDAIAAYRRQEKGLTGFFPFYGPASSERIRMACLDELSAASLEPGVAPEAFQPKGSW